jgi:hypothetical protein
MRNSTLICQICNSNFYLLNYQCVNITTCPIANKTYVTVAGMCKPCLNQCATCSNLTVNGCLTCNPNYNYYLGMCLTNCSQGYYALNQVCLMCITNCTSCTTTGCKICNNGSYLTASLQCIAIRYFLDSNNAIA